MVYACDRPVGASNLGSSPGRGNCVVSYIVTKLHHF